MNTMQATTASSRTTCSPPTASALRRRYELVRTLSCTLCEPLETEDYVIQSMPDVSPTRWHLAHTTWFFERFVLREAIEDYRPVNAAFEHLFNSYYNAVGEQFPRLRRGLLSRPTVAEVFDYRQKVDAWMDELLATMNPETAADLVMRIETGLNHEQQHQELMLTDIKHVFSCNPLFPAYRAMAPATKSTAPPLGWIAFGEGLRQVGHDGNGFCYDNERPRHQAFVAGFEIADRPVAAGEFMNFIDDGGYGRPELWLSEGWDTVCREGWSAPLYWQKDGSAWRHHTLGGLRDINPAEPVCHVSYFEADAFARWAGARLPTEAEWETAAADLPVEGNFCDSGLFHPLAINIDRPGGQGSAAQRMFGDVWEWTQSPYTAYPGFRPATGALGEYNGKFMCNQFVLRGGSCATPLSHIRATYRNFFPPQARWQFAGFRLAR